MAFFNHLVVGIGLRRDRGARIEAHPLISKVSIRRTDSAEADANLEAAGQTYLDFSLEELSRMSLARKGSRRQVELGRATLISHLSRVD